MPKSIQQYELDIAFLTDEIKITKKLVEHIIILINSNTQKEAIAKLENHVKAKAESNKLQIEQCKEKINELGRKNAERKILKQTPHIHCSTNTLVNAPPKFMPINRLAAKQVIKPYKKN
jgi:pyruvate-formate lyase